MVRRKNRGNGQMAQLVALLQRALAIQSQPPAPRTASQPARRRRRRRAQAGPSGATVNSDGGVSISRTELLGTLSLPAGQPTVVGHFDLVPDSCAFLKSLFKSFERIRWTKIHIYYKPAVGTTYGGLVSVGVDWDFSGADAGRSVLSAYTPNFTVSAWTDTQSRPMVLPPARLAGRAWYTPRTGDWIDKGPGKIHWAVDGTTSKAATSIGELWISYTAQLMGTNPA